MMMTTVCIFRQQALKFFMKHLFRATRWQNEWLIAIIPAEHSEHQVEHKKRTNDDKRNEIRPREIVADRVVRLKQSTQT